MSFVKLCFGHSVVFTRRSSAFFYQTQPLKTTVNLLTTKRNNKIALRTICDNMLDPKKIFFVPSEEIHFDGANHEAFFVALNNSPAAKRLHLKLLEETGHSVEGFLRNVSENVKVGHFKTFW